MLVLRGGRAVLERLGITHHQSLRLDTTEIVFLDAQHNSIGRLRFRSCGRACRTGLILDIWIHDAWQRQGLGRELLQTLVAHHSGVQWSTTRQTPLGQLFFAAMSEEMSVSFPQRGALCLHLAGWFTRAWRRLIG